MGEVDAETCSSLILTAALNNIRTKLEQRNQNHQKYLGAKPGIHKGAPQSSGPGPGVASPITAKHSSSAHSQTPRRVKRKPKVCECPKPHGRPSRQQKAADPKRKEAPIAGSQNSPGPGKGSGTKRPSDGDHLKSIIPSSGSAAESAQEKIAKQCTSCKKVVKAPRGKKLAWRHARNSWVYARPEAREDDTPEGEVVGACVETTEDFPPGTLYSDDDEETPPLKLDREEQAVETPSNGGSGPHGGVETTSRTIANGSQAGGGNDGPETDSQPTARHCQPRDANDAPESTSPVGTMPVVTSHDQQQSLNHGSSAKRRASSPASSSQAKKPCHRIDLTLDDDKDVIVKQEPSISTQTSNKVSRFEELDVDALEDELKAIELEEQVLRLGQKKLAIERELKKKRLQSG